MENNGCSTQLQARNLLKLRYSKVRNAAPQTPFRKTWRHRTAVGAIEEKLDGSQIRAEGHSSGVRVQFLGVAMQKLCEIADLSNC
jgi:hypothetical protein